MRFAVLFLLLPGLAWADDILLPAPVAEVVLYPNSLTLTRRDGTDVPEGAHRLLIPLGQSNARPQISLNGATLIGSSLAEGALVDGTQIYDPTQQAAQGAVDAAQAALEAAEDAADRAHAAAEAAAAEMAFWRSVSGEALTGLDPAALATTAAAVAEGVAAAQTAQVDARAALRAAEEDLEAASLALDQAKRDLEATGAEPGPVDLLILEVEAAGGAVDVALEQTAPGGWTPLYDAILDEEAGQLSLVRRVEMRQGSGLPMGAALVLLSTADPNGQSEPSPVSPNQAIVREADRSPQLRALTADGAGQLEFAAPAQALAPVQVDLPVLTYALPATVDIPVSGSATTVTLGTLDLPVRVFNRAAPRRDAFAYLMAEAAEGPGETLLPGPITRYRGATRVGRSVLPLTPAGEALELAFGPRRDLPLEFVLLKNETGEDGFFTTSGTRVQDMAIRLRNLSDGPETVETLFALPYSEQEALELTVRTTPVPSARDVDDAQGVARWDADLPAGGEVEIDIRVEAEWPEGQVLFWQP